MDRADDNLRILYLANEIVQCVQKSSLFHEEKSAALHIALLLFDSLGQRIEVRSGAR